MFVISIYNKNRKNKLLWFGYIIEVTMPFRNCVGASGGNQYVRYVHVWNIRSDKVLDEFSFNNFVKMIGVNFELCNY